MTSSTASKQRQTYESTYLHKAIKQIFYMQCSVTLRFQAAAAVLVSCQNENKALSFPAASIARLCTSAAQVARGLPRFLFDVGDVGRKVPSAKILRRKTSSSGRRAILPICSNCLFINVWLKAAWPAHSSTVWLLTLL